jgi:Bacterial Ig domain
MSRFRAAVFMIGLAAAKTATAAQGYIYQGLVGTSGTPGATSLEAMAAMPTGDLAVAYATSTGTSVIVFDNTGKQVKTIAFPKLATSAMAIDTNGRFIFLDAPHGRGSNISIYNSAGKPIISKNIGLFDSGFSAPANLVIGVDNSIILPNNIRGDSECNSKTYIYDANLKPLSSFSSLHCIQGAAAMGSNLLVAYYDLGTGASSVSITDYSGNTLGQFGKGLAGVFGPIATSLGQTRAFFPVQGENGDAGSQGLGVFDSTRKLLQSLPYPSMTIAALTSTTAGYFYVANPAPFFGIERFGPGTLPPLPVAKAFTVHVQAGHSIPINVTAGAKNGPFDYLGVIKPPTRGQAGASSFSTVTYTAGARAGADAFSYTIWNSAGSSTATVTVTVTPLAPVAGPAQTVTTTRNKAVTVSVTANARKGPFTSVAVATQPAHGTATVNKLNVIYTPAAGFAGQDSFTYTITNAGGTSAPGKVNVLVGN